ncbi:hypothetical protein MTO96_016497 [Rhipicephalus appendiculatus]
MVLDLRRRGYQWTSTLEADCVLTAADGGCCNGASSGASKPSIPVACFTSSWSCEVVDAVNVYIAEGRGGIRSSRERLIEISGEDFCNYTFASFGTLTAAGALYGQDFLRRLEALRSWVPADVDFADESAWDPEPSWKADRDFW